MKWSFLTNPFLWIIIAVIVVIILIVVVTRSQRINPPSSVCPEDKPKLCGDNCYDPTKDVCVDNKIICPTTKPKVCKETCYDPSSSECINDQICSAINICFDEGNKPSCCKDNEICTKQGKCVLDCPSGKTCTGGPGRVQCCDKNTDICTKSGICCDPKLYAKDSDFCCTPNVGDLCTDPDTGETTCCPYASGQYCLQGKCVVECPNPKQMDLYKCNGTPPPIPETPAVCTGKTPVCSVDCDKPVNNRYVCISQDDCDWDDIGYSPVSIGSDNSVKVCQARTGNTEVTGQAPDGTLWITSSFPNLYASASDVSGPKRKPTCGLNACIHRIRQKDSSIIVNDRTTYTPDKDGKMATCFSDLDCQKRLIDPTDQTKIDSVCTNLDGQCCVNNGKYTGQVCKNGEFCADIDGYGNKCYTGFLWNPDNYRCEPSNDPRAYRTLNQCIKNYCSTIRPDYERSMPCPSCKNENWRTCAFCPDWAAVDSDGYCNLTYRMPPPNMHDVSGDHDGEDGYILVCVPSSCTVSSNWGGYTTSDYGIYKDDNWPIFWHQYFVHPPNGVFSTDYNFDVRLTCGTKSVTYTIQIHSKAGVTTLSVSNSSYTLTSSSRGAAVGHSDANFNAGVKFGKDPLSSGSVYLSIPSDNYK